MADEKKISGLTEASDASASDEFVMVNKAVTSGADASASGQTSKITLDNLRNAILGGSSGSTGNDVVFTETTRIQPSDSKPGFVFGSFNTETPDGTYLQFGWAGEDNLSGQTGSKMTLQSLEKFGTNQGGYRDLILNEHGGNVGIGTNGELRSTLQVNGTLRVGNSWEDAYSQVEFKTEDNPNYQGGFSIKPVTVPGSGVSKFITRFGNASSSGAGDTIHDVSFDGNVGIGTSDPNEKFHVLGRSQLENSGGNHSSVVVVQCRANDNNGQTWNSIASEGHQGALSLLSSYDRDISGEGAGMTEGNWTGIDFNGVWSRKKKDEAGEFIEPTEIESSGFGMGQLLCQAPLVNTKNDGTSSLKSDMVLITRSHSGGLQERMRIGEDGMNLALAVIKDKGNVFIKSDSSGTHIGPAVYEEGGTGIVSFHKSSVVTGTDETVRIDHTGNVGIGADLTDMHPNYGLSIHNRGGILVRNVQGALHQQGNLIRGSISDRPEFDDWGVGINQVTENNSNGFGMAFWTRDAYNGTYTEKVRIDRNGLVGIGTVSPTGKLSLRGGNQVNSKTNIDFIGDGNRKLASIYSRVDETGDPATYGKAKAGSLHFTTTDDEVEHTRMKIGRDGVVTISYKLVCPTVTSSGLDAKDLDNVRATEASGLDNINNLVVSDFEKDGVTKTGIVAQDMQKVLPQSVSGGVEHEVVGADAEAPEREYVPLATSNDELVATLVKAVQELSAKNDELSAKNDELSAKNDELSAKVDELGK